MLRFEFIDPEKQIESEDFSIVESFLKSTGRTETGWHYITDITWIYSKIKNWPRHYKVLDAGGGFGLLQFLLAEMGFDVTNIDMNLKPPPREYKHRYKTKMAILDSYKPTHYKEHLDALSHENGNGKIPHKKTIPEMIKNLIKRTPLYSIYKYLKHAEQINNFNEMHNKWRRTIGINKGRPGRIEWIVGNLCEMPEIPSGNFDAVVSLSALEHIPLDVLPFAMNEIRRVLKPNAKWAITTSGTHKKTTWLHKSSQGYCFSEDDFKKYFSASRKEGTNPEIILIKYVNCDYLKSNLAQFYFKSDKNGMPWGRWDPKYIPVGITI